MAERHTHTLHRGQESETESEEMSINKPELKLNATGSGILTPKRDKHDRTGELEVPHKYGNRNVARRKAGNRECGHVLCRLNGLT